MKKVSGMLFSYYFICKRKMWLFNNYISMEQYNENVKIGKAIDKNSYARKYKNINVNNDICIDFLDNGKTIHEIKKSNKMEEAHIWQVKYYIYYLKNIGYENINGVIDYPLLRIKKSVELSDSDILRIEEIIEDINNILSDEIPKIIKKRKICNKCAYYDYCYIL